MTPYKAQTTQFVNPQNTRTSLCGACGVNIVGVLEHRTHCVIAAVLAVGV